MHNALPHNDIYALIPRICEYVTLHGKRDFEMQLN